MKHTNKKRSAIKAKRLFQTSRRLAMLVQYKYILYSYIFISSSFPQDFHYPTKSTDSNFRTIIQPVKPRSDINKFFMILVTNKFYSKLIDIQSMFFQNRIKLNLVLKASILKHFLNIAQIANDVYIDSIHKHVVSSNNLKAGSNFPNSNSALKRGEPL